MRLSPVTVLSTALLTLAFCTATAGAEDFCVAKPRCLGTAVSAAQFQARLAAAESNGQADRFVLGVATFADGPYVYDSDEPLEIVGTRSQTGSVLRSGTIDRSILQLVGAHASVSDVRLDLLLDTGVAVLLDGATASRVQVTHTGTPSMGVGVLLRDGAALLDSDVELGGVETAALGSDSGDTRVTGTRIAGGAGAQMLAPGGTMTLSHDTILAQIGAMAFGGTVDVSDTLIDAHASSGKSNVGLAAVAQHRGDAAALRATNVTIVGGDAARGDSAGVYAVATDEGTASLQLRDSAIANVTHPLFRFAENGGVADLSASYSAHADSAGQYESGPGTLTDVHRLPAPSGFADADAGDFRLAAGSPLIDAGDPDGAALPGALDLAGAPRLAEGDGDAACVARHDLGAYEYQRPAPCVPAVVPPVQPPVTPPTTPPVTPPRAPPARDRVKPVLSALRVPARITATALLPRLGATARTPAIAFRLSEPARVTATFARRVSTRRGGRTRVSYRAIRGASLPIAARAGSSRLRFGGRLTRRLRLAPGAYRVTLSAVDAAGNRSRAVTASFQIARGG